MTQNTDSGQATATVTWTPATATDNSGDTPTLAVTHNPGDSFPIGTTLVTYTFTDASSNSAVCTFSVTVNGKKRMVNCYVSLAEGNLCIIMLDCVKRPITDKLD